MMVLSTSSSSSSLLLLFSSNSISFCFDSFRLLIGAPVWAPYTAFDMKRVYVNVHTPQCICILLKISHLFPFRHLSTLRLFQGLCDPFFHLLSIPHFHFYWSDYMVSSFRSCRVFRALLLLLLIYQEFPILHNLSARCFHFDKYTQNQRWFRYDSWGSLHLLVVHRVYLFLFWSFINRVLVAGQFKWASVCGAQCFIFYFEINAIIYTIQRTHFRPFICIDDDWPFDEKQTTKMKMYQQRYTDDPYISH